MKWYLKVVRDNYANFDGRARRKEYWMFVLFNMIFAIIALMIDGALGTPGYIYMVYLLAVIIPGIAVSIRRMHDVGKSGWYILIPIYSFILTVTNGQAGENEYGEDPKGGEWDA